MNRKTINSTHIKITYAENEICKYIIFGQLEPYIYTYIYMKDEGQIHTPVL